MEYRFIGKTGCKVSAISLGSYLSYGLADHEDKAYECITKAYEYGINLFDTAESYNNGRAEIILGNISSHEKWKRKDYLISTKLFWGGNGVNDIGLSRKHLLEGSEASLDRLKISYIDYLYCHRPDLYTDIEDTVRTMTLLINQGKALYWGTSQWTTKQILTAFSIAKRKNLIPPTLEQVPYNILLKSEFKKIPLLMKKYKLAVITHSPLFSGLLTGKYHFTTEKTGRIFKTDGDRGEMNLIRALFSQESLYNNLEKSLLQIKKVADQIPCSLAQLSLAWSLSNPLISSVLIGSTNVLQLTENLKALEICKRLSKQQIKQLNHLESQFRFRNLLLEPKLMLKTFNEYRDQDYRLKKFTEYKINLEK